MIKFDNQIVLNAFPHPAMIINEDRKILASNATAKAAGAEVGAFCWKGFGQAANLSDEHHQIALENPDHPGIKCDFCRAEHCLTNEEEENDPLVNTDIGIFDTYWVPISNNTYLHYAIDVTEKTQAERALQASEEKVRLILNSTAEGIYGLDREGVGQFFNRAAQEILGYEEKQILGNKVHELLAHTRPDGTIIPDGQCCIYEVLEKGLPQHNDNGIMWTSDSTPLNVEYSIHPIHKDSQITGAVVTFMDITEKKKLIEQRIRSGQLSSLGELAAGVAHEINNPINGVINYAQILLNEDLERNKQKQILNNVMKEGNRIAVIVQSLLKYAHKDRTLMTALDISEIVRDPLQLLQQQLSRDGVFLDVDLDTKLPKIYGNSQKLVQVMLNLISNARHALNEKYPESDPNKILRISAIKQGDGESARVRLTLWDNGPGISEHHLDKIFNRFFTTKAAGVGTGLGLSLAHDLLEEHGAVIHVESEVGLFTKVTIDFPIFKGVDCP